MTTGKHVWEEEPEEERMDAIREFYRLYRNLQRGRSVRMRSFFNMRGENAIEIWEKAGTEKRYICRVEEESETHCYRKAAAELDRLAKRMEH